LEYKTFEILHAVLLLPFEILSPEGVDTVNHDLDQLNLGVSKTMLVGDVIGATSLATGFSAGSTGLDSEFLTPGLELVDSLLGPSREVTMDGSAHASSQVGGARVDISVLLVKHESLAGLLLDAFTDGSDTAGKALKDSLDITTLLHGDNTELILLIDPEKEGLGGIVEDSTAFGPVTLHTGNSEVGISGDEEEMIINKLLTDSLIHSSEGIVGSGKISFKSGQSNLHEVLNTNTLFLGDSGGKTESIDGATDTDTGGVNGNIGVDVSGDLGDIHVRGVLGVGRDAMVLLDDGIEDLSEVLVGIPISGVDAAVLVVELDSAGDGLGEGEAGGLGDDVLNLVPSLLSDVLGHQRVGGLDDGEISGHDACFGLY
jgi:hypothetical protein